MDSALDTPFNSPPPSTPVLRPVTMQVASDIPPLLYLTVFVYRCDKGISPILLTDALVHLEAEINRLEAQSSDDKMSSSPPSPARGGFQVSHDFIDFLEEERAVKLARRLKKNRVMENRRRRMHDAEERMQLSEGSEDGKSEKTDSDC